MFNGYKNLNNILRIINLNIIYCIFFPNRKRLNVTYYNILLLLYFRVKCYVIM